jgi:hypothetical protein
MIGREMTIVQYRNKRSTTRRMPLPTELIKLELEAFRRLDKELLSVEDFQPKIEIQESK